MTIWIKFSGASPKLLEKTAEFYEKESIKYGCYGRLVFVPAILGGIAGGYAISTIVDHQFVSVLFGILWFFIILFIDMAISATMYKSTKTSAKAFWVTVFVRLLFAICVGMVISHPLVLKVFEESISKNIIYRDRLAKETDLNQAQGNLDDARKTYNEQITALKNTNQCIKNLIQFETSRGNTSTKEFVDVKGNLCGYSSGRGGGCSSECEKRKQIIKDNEAEIEKIQAKRDSATKSQEQILSDVNGRKEIPPPTDYLERTEALDILMNGDGDKLEPHPHVSWAAKSLILFFIFLDILIVLLKALTPMGAYEHTVDLYLDRHIQKLKAENMIEVELLNASKKIEQKFSLQKLEGEEAVRLFQNTMDILTENAKAFENYKKEMRRKVHFWEKQKRHDLDIELFEMTEIYQNVTATTLSKLNETLLALNTDKVNKLKGEDDV